jgi:DNA modification methylase
MKAKQWAGCYDDTWRDIITPDAFAHPAKFSRALIVRIIEHGLERGYWKPGDTIGDPFGGIGTGGIECAYRGLRWIGVEIEIKFVELARKNFELHQQKLRRLGFDLPMIIQGDSRKFDIAVAGVVTSPPYAGTAVEKNSTGIDIRKNWERYRESGGGSSFEAYVRQQSKHSEGYGAALGQIGATKAGSLDAVISSPPYSGIAAGAGGLNTKPAKKAGQQSGRKSGASQTSDQRYGDSAGQISQLRGNGISAVVTSPPWENNSEGKIGAHKWRDPEKAAAIMSHHDNKPGRHRTTAKARLAQFERDNQKTYGDSLGQIGKENGETYWQAMALVYAACFRSIQPGGYIAIVVKDYVKNKKRVRLCDDTLKLLQHVGFVPVERIHAMLVEEYAAKDLFEGDVVTRKERKSFFRRLAEKKGSPRIDYEEVLFCQKQA